MNVNGQTKLIGIFGYPIEHTLSPLMHNSAFEQLGMNCCYIPFRVAPEDLPYAVQAIRSLNLLGVNITVPHKESSMPLLDNIDREAAFIGAINTVTNVDNILTGYNTDGRGFMSSLNEHGVSAEQRNITVIGAGGACRAISYYLSEKASRLSLFDLDKTKAEKLVRDLKEFRENVFLLDKPDAAAEADIVINATPLGMKAGDPPPVNPDIIKAGTVVYDLVYKKTKLLIEAEKKGAETYDGSGMLLWQGVLAFELWTGTRPPVDVMRKVLLSNIR